MNLLGAILGGLGISKLTTGSPKEIRNLRSQMTKSEQETFAKDYKGLSAASKKQFREYLQQADLAAAGSVIGMDLQKYEVTPVVKQAAADVTEPAAGDLAISDAEQVEAARAAAFNARIRHILDTGAPEIDPALVAEAAKRYEALDEEPASDFNTRIRRILDIGTPEIDPALVAEAAKRYEALAAEPTAVKADSNKALKGIDISG